MNKFERRLGLMLVAVALTMLVYFITLGLVGNALLIWIGVVNALMVSMYGWDKFQAQRGGQRTPEMVLHIWAFLGGWPGAILGQRFADTKQQRSASGLPIGPFYWPT